MKSRIDAIRERLARHNACLRIDDDDYIDGPDSDDLQFLLDETEALKAGIRCWKGLALGRKDALAEVQSENARLRAALERIMKGPDMSGLWASDRAREALQPHVEPKETLLRNSLLSKSAQNDNKDCPDCGRPMNGSDVEWRCDYCQANWKPVKDFDASNAKAQGEGESE